MTPMLGWGNGSSDKLVKRFSPKGLMIALTLALPGSHNEKRKRL